MDEPCLNEERLPGNDCFGCGLSNPAGLRIELARDPDDGERVVGTFVPREEMTGFPGIVHGGVIYTALDCLAMWTAATLRAEPGVAWLLRSATVKYHRPGRAGELLALSGVIKEGGAPGSPVVVHAEARNGRDEVVVDGDFKVVPLSVDRFTGITGVEELPENWTRFLTRA